MIVSWKRTSLALWCTTALLSITFFQAIGATSSRWNFGNHPILDVLGQKLDYNKRAITAIDSHCPLDSDSLAGAMFLHFTGIFFQDFTTGGGTDILGPLAVGGKFTAPNYLVNANRGQNCTADPATSFDGIGLVVRGMTDTRDTHVHGDSLNAGGGDLNEIKELNIADGCAVDSDLGTGAFDFDIAENAARRASLILAATQPNMHMAASGKVTDLGSGNSNYKVFTFNTCHGENCNVGGALSDPNAILLGRGNYNGPRGDVPSETDTVVFNIPVAEGSTINLLSNQPSKGFYACRTIYNFYPVNSEGNYSPNGEITIIRNTGGQIEGFTLAPRAHILDGRAGAFAGTIIGLDYGWYYGIQGVEIHDYNAADDHCANFVGCFPVSTPLTPEYSSTTITETISASEAAVTTVDTIIIISSSTSTISDTLFEATTITEGETTTSDFTLTISGTTYTTTSDITETEIKTETSVKQYTTELSEPSTIHSPTTVSSSYATTKTISGSVVTTDEITIFTSSMPFTFFTDDEFVVITTLNSVVTDVSTGQVTTVVSEPGTNEITDSVVTVDPGVTTKTSVETVVTVVEVSTISTFSSEFVTTIPGDTITITTALLVPPKATEESSKTVTELPKTVTELPKTVTELPKTATESSKVISKPTIISEYFLTTTTTMVYDTTITAKTATRIIYAYPEDLLEGDKDHKAKDNLNHNGKWNAEKKNDGYWQDDKEDWEEYN